MQSLRTFMTLMPGSRCSVVAFALCTWRWLGATASHENLHEAVEMVLDANRVLAEEALNGRNVIREPFVIVSQ